MLFLARSPARAYDTRRLRLARANVGGSAWSPPAGAASNGRRRSLSSARRRAPWPGQRCARPTFRAPSESGARRPGAAWPAPDQRSARAMAPPGAFVLRRQGLASRRRAARPQPSPIGQPGRPDCSKCTWQGCACPLDTPTRGRAKINAATLSGRPTAIEFYARRPTSPVADALAPLTHGPVAPPVVVWWSLWCRWPPANGPGPSHPNEPNGRLS